MIRLDTLRNLGTGFGCAGQSCFVGGYGSDARPVRVSLWEIELFVPVLQSGSEKKMLGANQPLLVEIWSMGLKDLYG